MFCDLVGSTALSSQLDPEELREVVRAVQGICAGVVQRYDGHIAQYLGDGILVYFGYPVAHEDEVQRAVYTGLEILEHMAEFNRGADRQGQPELSVRVGVHSGLVVVGQMDSEDPSEKLALGDTPNIAARVQRLAAPNTLLITYASQQLAGKVFDYQPLGARNFKGVSKPMEVYRVLGRAASQ